MKMRKIQQSVRSNSSDAVADAVCNEFVLPWCVTGMILIYDGILSSTALLEHIKSNEKYDDGEM